MKKLKILAAIMAIGILMTACNSNKDDNNKNTSSNGGVVSSIVSDGEKVVSGVESGAEEVISGVESGVESIIPGDNDDNDNSSKTAKNDASEDASFQTADKVAAANAKISQNDFSNLASLDTTKNGWGQGTHIDEKNRPISCLEFQEKYGSYGAQFIAEDNKNIYLTFDEGYENGYTEKILDVLKEKECPAVFFVTMPYVKENPDLIRRMIDEGHTVGNHSVNHPSMPTLTLEQAADEITQLHDYVKQEFQYEMTLFRPPMGEWSEQSLTLTQQLGYQSIFWSFAYRDWETDNQPEQAASLEKITNAAHNGAIYLLHAVSSTNTAILGDFIENLRTEGYTFAKMGANG